MSNGDSYYRRNRWEGAFYLALSLALLSLLTCRVEGQDRPSPTDNEVTWSKYLAATVAGEAEHVTPDGARVDVLTDDVAWEVEWCSKWPESFGQSAFYAAATGRRAGVWLLKRGKQDDEDYLQALATLYWYRSHGVAIEFRVEDVTKERP